jgi:hypothetical protein
MRRKTIVGLLSLLALTLGSVQLARAAPNKVTICHKPGTPAEKTMQVPSQAVAAHIGHGDTMGPCGAPTTTTSPTTTTTIRPTGCAAAVSDVCIDGDGIASPLPGSFEVQVGDPLRPFPDNLTTLTGLDLFDRAPLGVLTQDDDLHAEDPALCPTAIRNAVHDLGLDCKVLDINGDLANGEFVTADCEFGGCSGPPFFLKFHDADGDGDWDQGEDLVADNNNNGVFD